MIDRLLELVIAGIILAAGLGIGLVLLGADPKISSMLISGVTRLGAYLIVIGVLVAIPASLLR